MPRAIARVTAHYEALRTTYPRDSDTYTCQVVRAAGVLRADEYAAAQPR